MHRHNFVIHTFNALSNYNTFLLKYTYKINVLMWHYIYKSKFPHFIKNSSFY